MVQQFACSYTNASTWLAISFVNGIVTLDMTSHFDSATPSALFPFSPPFLFVFRPSSCSLAPTYLEGEIWLTSLGEDGVGDIELGL